MDATFELLLHLTCSKAYQEQLVNELKRIHSFWDVEREEDQVIEESTDSALTCIDLTPQEDKPNEEEDIAEIDKLISKAQSIISKYNNSDSTKSSHQPSTKRINSTLGSSNKPPLAIVKKATHSPATTDSLANRPSLNPGAIKQKIPSSSNLLLNSKTKAPAVVPVYMNAPYKTQPQNTFKRSKSSSTIRSTSAQTGVVNPNHAANSNPTARESSTRALTRESDTFGQNGQSTAREFAQQAPHPSRSVALDSNVLHRLDALHVERTPAAAVQNHAKTRVNFKEIAPTLSFSHRMSNLINSNLKLNISIDNEFSRRACRGPNNEPNPFISKLNRDFVEKNNASLASNYQFLQKRIATKRALQTLNKHMFYLNFSKDRIQKMSKNDQFLLLFKLKILIKNAKLFGGRLREAYGSDLPDSTIKARVTQDGGGDLLEFLRFYESVQPVSSPRLNMVFYEKELDLRRLVEVKCDLMELKFKAIVLDYLKKTFLDVIRDGAGAEADENNSLSSYQCVNLLFNLILDKRTVIVK